LNSPRHCSRNRHLILSHRQSWVRHLILPQVRHLLIHLLIQVHQVLGLPRHKQVSATRSVPDRHIQQGSLGYHSHTLLALLLLLDTVL
jgi:hypothetical protein